MFTLRLHCVDQPGIVAAVATALSDSECNIEDSSQFHDRLSGQFFMRVVFSPMSRGAEKAFLEKFQHIAEAFDMTCAVRPQKERVKTLVMVSKEDHCLNDILYRWRTDHLQIDITGVVSNHEDSREVVEDRGLSFHYMPVAPESKAEQEAALGSLVDGTETELIVLARYMQVLSPEFCNRYAGQIINIHHSFLPGFKGARPYHQAYERGVKIIGATAHFATDDLDEGPIIEQATERINHSYTPERMRRLGRDTEARVLARAIELYTERRIFLHDGRTVIL